jgi:aerobic-type carbon monoxide dehydrogenase small subunit (CoxS/CutS family)
VSKRVIELTHEQCQLLIDVISERIEYHESNPSADTARFLAALVGVRRRVVEACSTPEGATEEEE